MLKIIKEKFINLSNDQNQKNYKKLKKEMKKFKLFLKDKILNKI